jgi:hypothetical protein
MAELNQLKSKRKQIRSAITRFENFVKNFQSTDNIRTLRLRYENFKPILHTYNEIQDNIDILNADAEASESDNERIDDETRIYNVLAQAEDLIEKSSIIPSTTSTEVKLPTINLPHFNGEYTEWTVFYDSFLSLIHENAKLENIQKLHYLRSCLGDEPRRIIESLSVSADSYNTAWQLLKERYQNKLLIVQHHINALFNLPQVTKSPNSLRSLLDQTNAHLESKAQRLEVDKWDALIIYLITIKLDFATKREWESKLNCELPTMDEMKSYLKQRCQALEAIDFGNIANKPNYQQSNKSKPVEFSKRTAHVVAQDNCVKCTEKHFLYQCPTFRQLNENERFEEAKRLKLCINCLQPGHDAKNCNSRTCKTCNKKHHTLLHFTKRETNQASNVSNHCHSDKAREVLLSTALVKVRDINGDFHEARALVDVASQEHFITEHLCKLLKLKQIHKNIPISGIGRSHSNITRITDLVFKSVTGEYSEKIQCLVLPKITNDLPLESFDPSNLNIPENLALADPTFYLSSRVDILIGAAVFYDLLRDGRIKLTNDKTYLQNSCLGWLIGGPYTIAVAEINKYRLCHVVS